MEIIFSVYSPRDPNCPPVVLFNECDSAALNKRLVFVSIVIYVKIIIIIKIKYTSKCHFLHFIIMAQKDKEIVKNNVTTTLYETYKINYKFTIASGTYIVIKQNIIKISV